MELRLNSHSDRGRRNLRGVIFEVKYYREEIII